MFIMLSWFKGFSGGGGLLLGRVLVLGEIWYLSDFDEISQKFSCHGPLQNLLKKFDSFKNSGCHGNKTQNFLKSLKIFWSETIRLRATKFGM